jgi:hypothetical protein
MYDRLLAKAPAREGGAQKHVRTIRMGKLPFPRTLWERSRKRMRSAEAIAQIVCSRGQPTLTIAQGGTIRLRLQSACRSLGR